MCLHGESISLKSIWIEMEKRLNILLDAPKAVQNAGRIRRLYAGSKSCTCTAKSCTVGNLRYN